VIKDSLKISNTIFALLVIKCTNSVDVINYHLMKILMIVKGKCIQS